MQQVIYGDILFFVNFSMDFIVLFCIGKVTSRRLCFWRMIFSAILAALYACVILFFQGNPIIDIFLDVEMSALAVAIAFPSGRVYEFVKLMTFFYIFSFLLGGAMTVFYRIFIKIGGLWTTQNRFSDAYLPINRFILLLISIVFFGWLAIRMFCFTRIKKYATVTVVLFGKKKTICCLNDSGNLLRDPVSGLSVIMVWNCVLNDLMGEKLLSVISSNGTDMDSLNSMTRNEQKRLRVLPITGACGEKIVYGFLPDYIEIDGEKKRCIIAVDTEHSSADGEQYSGVCPHTLIS